MTQWYYANEGQQIGPIDEPEFLDLIAAGGITRETQVWTEGLEQWVPAGDVEGLIPSVADGLPEQSFQHYAFPETVTDTSPPVDKGQAKAHKAQVKAQTWNRYWARLIDFCAICFCGGFIIAILFPSGIAMSDALFGVIMLFVYVFIEAAMLSSWGTTPGKALLRIRLRKDDGSKLLYGEALNRSFKVWLKGEGFGIPLINFITNIIAYKRLMKNGITSWDEEGGFTVSHKKVGFFRNLVAILIIFLVVLLNAAGNVEV